ncbi:ATP-binding protein [Phenylobacterium sp.]|uniref:sensor histidine kinase n=1 Tax=Phenylobacterium sp. TaxID=1871053 RepID=UPI0011FCBE9A|nr:ATP-binding protein [Phenylobacterium sp.]THD62383.1 MAG: HAMP domain-containing protein [Phenylobacterium sp.]
MARLPQVSRRFARLLRGPATLHGRVMLAACAALAASLAVGALALVWDARRSVDAELASAMASAAQAVRTGVQEEAAPGAGLPRLVRVFDGNRHVRAILLNSCGVPQAVSRPYVPADPPPGWFVALIDPHAPARQVSAPGYAAIRLEPTPVNEIGEVWTGLRDALLIVGLLSVLALVLIRRAVTRALRPLQAVSGAFARVGAGDFEARVAAAGTVEIERLAQGFNAMAGQLDAIDRENRRLHEQLATVQEEERAEIARDLHDEIGPYLFAVSIDAAAEPPRVELIQTAVAHMQTQVTDMLRRLRPLRAVEFGLTGAVEDLVAFWRARRPDVAFDLAVTVDDAALGVGLREALYRVAQEALSNAVRHGGPSRISLALDTEAGETAVLRVADNGATAERPGGRLRFGLAGMRERIAGLGGELSIDPGTGQGWTVTARVPLRLSEALS